MKLGNAATETILLNTICPSKDNNSLKRLKMVTLKSMLKQKGKKDRVSSKDGK